MIVIVSGPSGCGKSTLIRRLRESLGGLAFSVSATTRKPRPTEENGVDYHFTTRGVFEAMARDGQFVEWARVHGNLYGTPWGEVKKKRSGADLLLDIDVQGARLIRHEIPEAVVIFVLPPGYRELRRRLEQRKEDSREQIERRLADAREEVLAYSEFDFVVVNDDLERAAEELRSIIIALRCRTAEKSRKVRAVVRSFSLDPSRKKAHK